MLVKLPPYVYVDEDTDTMRAYIVTKENALRHFSQTMAVKPLSIVIQKLSISTSAAAAAPTSTQVAYLSIGECAYMHLATQLVCCLESMCETLYRVKD